MKNKESHVFQPGKQSPASADSRRGVVKNPDHSMKKEMSGSGKSPLKTNTTRTSTHPNAGLWPLFESQLKDIYWAEKTLVKTIPDMIRNATSAELITALTDHLRVTEKQVVRCEEIFNVMQLKPATHPCEAMKGLLKEANEIIDSTPEGSVRDAGIICAGQKIEHYEIATYGTLAAFARQLGEEEAILLLEETLNEEKEADYTLTNVAERGVNSEARLISINEDHS